jgi:glucokinase
MAKSYIGIDLGGTFIKFGLLRDDLHAGSIFQLPTPIQLGGDGIVAQMAKGVEQLIATSGVARSQAAAVGVGCPGPLDIRGGLVVAAPNIKGMENYPIRDRLSAAVKLPAVLENDANAAAFGEYLCGAGAGTRNMVMLTLGTGVGGGVIVEGQVVHGSHDAAGEMGHMIIVPGGELCGCG